MSSEKPPTSYLPHTVKPFPETRPAPFLQQFDLVPTLSLHLGLPIPFNNLGTVIPELFWQDRSGSDYAEALDINARQVHAYLYTFWNSLSRGELYGTCGEPRRLLGLIFTGAGQKKGLKPQSIIFV